MSEPLLRGQGGRRFISPTARTRFIGTAGLPFFPFLAEKSRCLGKLLACPFFWFAYVLCDFWGMGCNPMLACPAALPGTFYFAMQKLLCFTHS